MLVKTSKYLLILIIILITGCSENKVEKIDNIRLNEKLAEELVSLSVKCVDKKYPYKIGYRFSDESWLKPHYELCLLYTSPSPRDAESSRMPSSA